MEKLQPGSFGEYKVTLYCHCFKVPGVEGPIYGLNITVLRLNSMFTWNHCVQKLPIIVSKQISSDWFKNKIT